MFLKACEERRVIVLKLAQHFNCFWGNERTWFYLKLHHKVNKH